MSLPADRNALAFEFARICSLAAVKVMEVYNSDFDTRGKADRSPVTDADELAEAIILEELARCVPDVPVLAEESFSAGLRPDTGRAFILVDPVDGTKEFINKNGEFTVNIALVEHRQPVAGVVYAPAKERMFFGYGSGKAFEETVIADKDGKGEGKARAIAARKPDADGLIVIASRTHRDTKTDEYLNLYKVKEFLAAGSSLKFCLIAAGEADLYPRHGRTMEWDTAAGHAVLAAAGGSVTQLDGTPLLYGKTERGLDNPFFVARGAIS